MTETKPRFAWCFSHGRLHTFWTDETPWCTATWVWLDGTTEDEAMQIKASAYGEPSSSTTCRRPRRSWP